MLSFDIRRHSTNLCNIVHNLCEAKLNRNELKLRSQRFQNKSLLLLNLNTCIESLIIIIVSYGFGYFNLLCKGLLDSNAYKNMILKTMTLNVK